MEIAQIHAMSWAEIEFVLDQVVAMQADSTYTYHYPEKQSDLAYIRSKVMEIKNHLNAGNTLFAGVLQDEILLGYIWCYTGVFIDKKRLNINSIYVLSEVKGSGLAQALMAFAENWARTQGCSEFATHYATFNERAGNFYLAQGYTPIRVEMVKKVM